MGILLSFCDSELRASILFKPFTKNVILVLWRKSDSNIFDILVVGREACKSARFEPTPTIKLFEVWIDDGATDLSGSIGSKVKENDTVSIFHGRFWSK